MKDLIRPHGGSLAELMVSPERVAELQAQSRDWPSWDLTPRQVCDLELLMNGGFSPLRGFMGRGDYESVCASMRLVSGELWPIPVVLDLPEATAWASAMRSGCQISSTWNAASITPSVSRRATVAFGSSFLAVASGRSRTTGMGHSSPEARRMEAHTDS